MSVDVDVVTVCAGVTYALTVRVTLLSVPVATTCQVMSSSVLTVYVPVAPFGWAGRFWVSVGGSATGDFGIDHALAVRERLLRHREGGPSLRGDHAVFSFAVPETMTPVVVIARMPIVAMAITSAIPSCSRTKRWRSRRIMSTPP